MKPLPKFDKRAAIAEAEEAKTWWCVDCGVATEEGQTTCVTCQRYWADVDNGIFSDYPEPYHYTEHDLDHLYEHDDDYFNSHDLRAWEDW